MRRDQAVFWGFLSWIGGAGAASFFTLPFDSGGALLAGALLFAALFVFRAHTTGHVLLLGLVFLASYAWTERTLRSFDGLGPGPVEGVGRIVRDPEPRDFYRHTVIVPERCASALCPERAILWQAPLSTPYAAGTRLSFRCAAELPENFSPDFDYRMYLAKEGVSHVCKKMGRVEELPADLRGELLRGLYAPKHFFERTLSRALPEPEAGLAKGLLLGGNNYLAKDFQEAFQRTGLSHLIAISGYNITIIIKGFLLLGLGAGLWRRQALYAALIGIVLFVLMIGVPSSAVRASLMAGAVFLAWESGRLSRPIPVLVAAAAILLLINPLLLRYDIGYQLSFLATLALITVEPFESRLFPRQ